MTRPFVQSSALAVLLALLAVPSAVARPLIPSQLQRQIEHDSQIKIPLPTPRIPLLPSCPDPAVESINFRLLSRDARWRSQGQVQITGTIINKGRSSFESRPNQQGIYLYEGNRLVARRNFQTLAPGESISVSFERRWDAASEFPPNYRLRISYDPDIYIDGNPKNDDCGRGNNLMERSGFEVHDLFR